MSVLPRVTERTRERVSREFDDLGPAVCVAHITAELQRDNPEILDMATKCARDTTRTDDVFAGFSMIYRLLVVAAATDYRTVVAGSVGASPPLPRVSENTRDQVVREIDRLGPEGFTTTYIENLERENPELLHMAHRFATLHDEYIQIMQGVALLWASLILQWTADRGVLH
jgi:hypothetical protein